MFEACGSMFLMFPSPTHDWHLIIGLLQSFMISQSFKAGVLEQETCRTVYQEEQSWKAHKNVAVWTSCFFHLNCKLVSPYILKQFCNLPTSMCIVEHLVTKWTFSVAKCHWGILSHREKTMKCLLSIQVHPSVVSLQCCWCVQLCRRVGLLMESQNQTKSTVNEITVHTFVNLSDFVCPVSAKVHPYRLLIHFFQNNWARQEPLSSCVAGLSNWGL